MTSFGFSFISNSELNHIATKILSSESFPSSNSG